MSAAPRHPHAASGLPRPARGVEGTAATAPALPARPGGPSSLGASAASARGQRPLQWWLLAAANRPDRPERLLAHLRWDGHSGWVATTASDAPISLHALGAAADQACPWCPQGRGATGSRCRLQGQTAVVHACCRRSLVTAVWALLARRPGRLRLVAQRHDLPVPTAAGGPGAATTGHTTPEVPAGPSWWEHQLGQRWSLVRCGSCQRPLHDPVFIALGVGPVCAQRARYGPRLEAAVALHPRA